MNWFIDVVKKYAVFNGRARRKEYWMYVLFYILIYVGLFIIESLVGSPGILVLILGLGLLVPSIAVTIRRLHDTDRSGWWMLLAFIPIIGAIWLFVLMILGGTRGPNRFGPDPVEVGEGGDLQD